jgi:DoxX-like family
LEFIFVYSSGPVKPQVATVDRIRIVITVIRETGAGENRRMPSAVGRALIAVLCTGLAAFFGFVGWNKAFASLEDLARYGAWTFHLPEWLGRAVGWSEMALALGLLAALAGKPRLAHLSALLLVANQLAAGAVHLTRGETAALPQNAVLIALLSLIVWAVRPAPHQE